MNIRDHFVNFENDLSDAFLGELKLAWDRLSDDRDNVSLLIKIYNYALIMLNPDHVNFDLFWNNALSRKNIDQDVFDLSQEDEEDDADAIEKLRVFHIFRPRPPNVGSVFYDPSQMEINREASRILQNIVIATTSHSGEDGKHGDRFPSVAPPWMHASALSAINQGFADLDIEHAPDRNSSSILSQRAQNRITENSRPRPSRNNQNVTTSQPQRLRPSSVERPQPNHIERSRSSSIERRLPSSDQVRPRPPGTQQRPSSENQRPSSGNQQPSSVRQQYSSSRMQQQRQQQQPSSRGQQPRPFASSDGRDENSDESSGESDDDNNVSDFSENDLDEQQEETPPHLEAYAQEDPVYGGGEQIRTIYCGLGPLPPESIYGNRLACFRKGYGVGRHKISAW